MFHRRTRAAAVIGSAALVALTACSGASSPGSEDASAAGDQESQAPEVTISANVAKGAQAVPVDTMLQVKADQGTLSKVSVKAPKQGEVKGKLAKGGAVWRAADRALEPGATYTITASGTDTEGRTATTTQRFTTKALTLDEQTYPSIAPLDGETVGVGMPVVVNFDVPVTDKATFEKHMTVTSQPAQPGTWHWVSDNEAHWRPKTYWQAGTDVSVDLDLNSLPAGQGVYGQEDRAMNFEVGEKHVYRIDTRTHQMKVFSGDQLVRTIPVTTGKPGFITRSGVKVIMEKNDSRRMRSETVGIATNSSEGYDLDNVQWAMRLTSSGEFIHAAPWSVGSQGSANVSHGCTGLSTADASWLYDMTLRGDVVETVGSGRPMEATNGYGDWNVSYADYREGSALS